MGYLAILRKALAKNLRYDLFNIYMKLEIDSIVLMRNADYDLFYASGKEAILMR